VIRSVVRLARRDPALVVLAARLYVLLIVMRGVVAAVPLRRISRRLGEHMRETPTDGVSEEQMRFARRVGWCILKVAPRTPTNSNCYPQALAAWWVLHRKHIPTTYYYGAAFRRDTPELEAHVWLRSGDLIVTGGRTDLEFRPLSMYADEPGTRRTQRAVRRPCAR
jgi:hypothetical protein